MSDTRHLLEPGWVLHSRPYRNTSSIIEFFVRNHGRVAVVARGVRRPKSSARSAVRQFTPLIVSWSARHELGSLIGAEAAGPPVTLSGESVMSGLYINELLMRLLRPSDAHPQLFDDYSAALERLAVRSAPEPTLRIFEKRLLEHLGYGLNLTREMTTNRPIIAEETYAYRVEQGAIPVRQGNQNQLTVAGESLLNLAAEELNDMRSLRDAQRVLRHALDQYLGERPLMSRRVMRAMQRYTAVS